MAALVPLLIALTLPTVGPDSANSAQDTRSQISFYPNLGQAGQRAVFHADGAGHTILFQPGVIVLRRRSLDIDSSLARTSVEISFPGSNADHKITGADPVGAAANFYLGSDANRWQSGVPGFGAVRYDELYDGVDLLFANKSGVLKREFHLAAHADPAAILMKYNGTSELRIDDDGSLVASTQLGELSESPPISFQIIDGQRHRVESRYRLADPATVSFELGPYDPNYPLIIDPDLSFATYLGGSGIETVNGLAEDAAGNLLATGWTNSNDFPMMEAYQSAFAGVFDAYISKIDPVAPALVFSTFLGGGGNDFASGVAVDAAGNSYIVGTTRSDNFPTLGAIQAGRAGGDDAFVAKFSPSGELVFSTYLGGAGTEFGMSIEVVNGAVFVTGITNSDNFPTVDPLQAGRGGGFDVFVTRMAGDGSEITFSTYLGGSAEEGNLDVMGLSVDPDENIYVTSWTESDDFANQGRTDARGRDVYVAAIRRSSSASGKVVALYDSVDVVLPFDPTEAAELNKEEQGNDIYYSVEVGVLVVVGLTESDAFPTSENAPGRETDNRTDGFYAQLDPATLQVEYSTLLAGPGADKPWVISPERRPVGKSGDLEELIWIAGTTDSFALLAALSADGTGSGFLLGVLLLRQNPLFQAFLRFGNNQFTIYGGVGLCLAGAITFFGTLFAQAVLFANVFGNQDAMVACAVPPEGSDLSVVSKEVEPDSAWPGEEVTYKIKVRNDGPNDLDEIAVVDEIPDGIDVVEGDLEDGCTLVGNTVVCSTSLAAGEEKEIEIKAKVSIHATGSLTNEVAVASGGNADPEPSNDRASATVTVRPMQTRIVDPNTRFHRLVVTGGTFNGFTNPWEKRNQTDDVDEVTEDVYGPDNQAPGSTVRHIDQPSREEFEAAVDGLKKLAQPGEEVTIHFFGHGWDGRNDQSSAREDEPTTGDESIWINKNTAYHDDNFGELIQGFRPGVTIVVILGSCFGGGFADGANDIQESQAVSVIGVSTTCPQDSWGIFDVILLPAGNFGLTGMFVETLAEDIADGGEGEADADGDGVVTADEMKAFLIAEGWQLGGPTGETAAGKFAVENDPKSSKSFCLTDEFLPCPGLATIETRFGPLRNDSVDVTITGRDFGEGTEVSIHLAVADTVAQTVDTLRLADIKTPGDSFAVTVRIPWLDGDDLDGLGPVTMLHASDSEGYYDWLLLDRRAISVDSEGDGGDSDLQDRICDDGSDACTLRAALEEANAFVGPAVVRAAADLGSTAIVGPVAGARSKVALVVRPDSMLPGIVQPIHLDGEGRLDLDGSNLSNSENGLLLRADGSTITGLTIHSFPGAGVVVEDGMSNTIRRNTFSGNGLPIDLGGDGPTENDPGDADEGPNRLMNGPEIRLSEVSSNRFTVHYSVDADTKNAAYPLTIDFYARDGDDAPFTWVAEHEYTAEGGEQEAVFFAPVTAGVELAATATDAEGNTSELGSETTTVVDLETDELPPEELALKGAYPNPFSGITTIPIEVPVDVQLRLEVFDLLGRRVATILDGSIRAGRHRIEWDVSRTKGGLPASGSYVIRLEADGEVRTARVLLAR